MLQDASAFKFNHIFTVVQATADATNYYHFGTHLSNPAFNQIYINHFDLLEKFILHFNDSIQQSPRLKTAYTLEIELNSRP